ncbi:MAG: single-stranded DNA-binding protein [Cytophagales bacterium]|nr:MAG: single-stranded DNA-binding protein [Cytophagales bacterium]
MAGVNKVILLGHLGKDPEIRAVESGRRVCSFTLATTESYKDKNGEKVENTEWHNVVFWGPVVDVFEKYVKKGTQIYIEGKLRTRSYESKEGVKKYITEVLGESMTLLGSPRNQDQSASSGNYQNSGSSSSKASSEPSFEKSSIDETDDLPF